MCCVVACQRSVHSRQEHRSVEQDQREGSECEHEVYKSTALVLPSHDFCTTHIHQSHVRATLRHSSLQQGTQALTSFLQSNRGHLFYSVGQLHTNALQLHRLLGQSSESHPILSECTLAYNTLGYNQSCSLGDWHRRLIPNQTQRISTALKPHNAINVQVSTLPASWFICKDSHPWQVLQPVISCYLFDNLFEVSTFHENEILSNCE